MGGVAPPPTPPLIFIAPHSQARPSSPEQETTCDTFSTSKLIREFKSVDSYEDGDLTPEIPVTVDTFESPKRCESPKTSTVTRMATLPSAIPDPCNCRHFEFRTSSESRNTSTVTRMATVTPAIPVTIDTFESPRRCEGPETSTVTRMATLPSAIPVTVDIFEFRTSSESRNTSTVTRMATVTPAIPVTVDTFRI